MRRVSLGAVAVILATVSCGGLNSPENNTKANFSGTVQPLGQSDHSYTFTKRGELEVTITSVTPTPPSGQLVLGVGAISNGICYPFSAYVVAIVVNSPTRLRSCREGAGVHHGLRQRRHPRGDAVFRKHQPSLIASRRERPGSRPSTSCTGCRSETSPRRETGWPRR